jgi:hypothetical protein
LRLYLCVAVVWSVFAPARGDAETLHVFNGQVVTGRVRAQLHSRMRSRSETGQELYQARVGPILGYSVHKRVELVAGYYYLRQKSGIGNWSDFHRSFSGVEWQPFSRDDGRLEHRFLVERFHGGSFESYTRYRTRLRGTLEWNGVWPWASAEGLTERGRAYPRFTAGVRWPILGIGFIETGYELRRLGRVNAHIFATALQWEFKPQPR